MKHVVKENRIKEIRFSKVRVKELFDSNNPSVSIAKIKLSGTNEKNKNTSCHNFYYILEGKGSFSVGNQKYSIKKGDLVCIPKNTTYQDSGRLVMLAVAVPKFNPKKVVFLK